jgi:hypothetical protein
MQPGGSIPCTQQPTTGTYPKQYVFSMHNHLTFLYSKNSAKYYLKIPFLIHKKVYFVRVNQQMHNVFVLY